MSVTVRPVGDLLREWRQHRRLSQLELSLEAEISTRHLSFLETGRSQPSRDMVLRLAERLDVPLRDRNLLLHAAGYASVFPERPLDDPALAGKFRALLGAGAKPFECVGEVNECRAAVLLAARRDDRDDCSLLKELAAEVAGWPDAPSAADIAAMLEPVGRNFIPAGYR